METGFSNLEEVDFVAASGTTPEMVWETGAFTDVSKLRSLTLSGVWIGPSYLLQFRHLSSLSLCSLDEFPHISRDYLLETLPFLPELRTLELALGRMWRGEEGKRKLGELRRCKVSGGDADIVTFLRLFEMPQAVDLDFGVEARRFDVENPTYEEQLVEAVAPYFRRFDSAAKRMHIVAWQEDTSVVTVRMVLGVQRLRVSLQVPSAEMLCSTTKLMKDLGLVGVDHLVLTGGLRSSGNYVEDEGWAQLFELTSGLKKLTITGYGDRWHQLALLIGKCGTSDEANLLPWSSLEEMEMWRGFWVKVDVADDWVEALRSRQRRGIGLRTLSFSKWEMQAGRRYEEVFKGVVQDLEWKVARPGLTEERNCPHLSKAMISSGLIHFDLNQSPYLTCII